MPSALTRILNNQILDATIVANQKIKPGTITGTLFNSNITVTSDFLITGNLTVLGASTTTTVASTNTFINDPLIVMNNAFSGTNTYDLGMIFNRGSATNQAFVWNEFNKEFRLLATTETGSTYGNINQTSYANISLGNLTVQYDQTARNITTSGDLIVNGGDITTTATTFTLLPTTASTVQAFNAATTANIGAGSGTITINNPTLVGQQTTQNLYNTVATTMNFAGAATSLNVGANSGTLTIGNPTVVGTQTSQALYNSVATTLNFAGAATTLSVGASSGTTTFNSLTESTAAGVGAVVVAGGVGVGKSLFVGKDAYVWGNLTVQGTTTYVNSQTLSVQDNIIELNTAANGQPLSATTSNDVGVRAHYYNGADRSMFFGRTNDTGFFEVYGNVTSETSGNISGIYGTIKSGNLIINGNIVTGNAISLLSGGRFTIGADLKSNVLYPEVTGQITSNANIISKFSIQNLSTGSGASSEFTAIADNGSNILSYMSTGIVGSGYSQSQAFLAGDGFAYAAGGNLVIATAATSRDIVFAAGGAAPSNIIGRFSGTNANLAIVTTNAATTPTTGALTVAGGVGIGGNLVIAGQGVRNFQINSINDIAGVFYDPRYKSLIINGPSAGANTQVLLGSVLTLRSTDSMMLPTGSSAQRPGSSGNVDTAGMIRYNTTISSVEYYDGANWNIAGSVFTVISDRQFAGNIPGGYGNVDGTNYTFTIQANASTASTLVSINGVVQFPTLAYSVSGTTLTFTESPAPGDVIDVRVLTTTATVTTLSSGNGYNQFIADTTGSAIWTGTGVTTQRLLVDPVGNFNYVGGVKDTYTQTPVNVPSSGSAVLIDTWSVSSYGTAKYIVQTRNGSNRVESMEAMLVAEGSNASVTTYAIVNSNGTMGTLSANVVSGNAQLYYTSTSLSNSNVKVVTTLIV